jgi:hypothetical protein
LSQIFKEKTVSVSHKLFEKIDEKGILLNSFYETRIALILNPYKIITSSH